MKSYFVIALALFANVVSIFGDRITFEDPNGGLAEQYLEEAEKAEAYTGRKTSSRRQFVNLADKNKRQLCLGSLNSAFFSLVTEDFDVKGEYLTAELHHRSEEIDAYYADDTKPKTVDLQVQVGIQQKEIKGIPCSLKNDVIDWAIIDGVDGSHFYTMGEYNTQVRLLALVDTLPTIKDSVSQNQKKLELAFKKSQQEFDAATNKRSVHTLNKFNKFKACSSAYMVWAKTTIDITKKQFVRETQDSTIEAKTTIKSLTGVDFNFSASSTVHIIPCTIITGPTKEETPQFYLAADQTHEGTSFLLVKQNGDTKYTAKMQLNNVLGLQESYLIF